MNTFVRGIVLLILALSLCAVHPAADLPRSAPERQGVPSSAVLDFVTALDAIDGMHSVMVLRHGHVIAEGWWAPYRSEHKHILYSLSKSFTSTAVGFAVAEGKLSIDDEVIKFFPDALPPNVTNNLKAMRVRDLLTMSTGHQDEPPTAPDLISAKSFLAHPVPHLPGTHFKYNTPATFMQSAIVQKVAGQTVLDYLRPRLFEPLGIESPVWDANFEGISLGGYGMRVRTEDIARFGQLYLQRGKWNGKQLLPAGWIAMATAKQTSNGSNPASDWNQGYGFQFWRCRHNAYRGDGAFGQYCVVMPEQDAVVVITSGIRNMQAPLNLLWEKLLPAMQPQPLAANASAREQLTDKLTRLHVPPAQGTASSPGATKLLNRKFTFSTNEQRLESVIISTGAGPNELVLDLTIAGRTVKIPCGHHAWKDARAPVLTGLPDEPTAGTFGWLDDTLLVKLCAYETPFHTTLKVKADGNSVKVDAETNVAFGRTKWPQVVGMESGPAGREQLSGRPSVDSSGR